MNRKDAMLFKVGMTVYYQDMEAAREDIGTVTKVEPERDDPKSFKVWAKWSDGRDNNMLGRYLNDFDNFVFKGDLKHSFDLRTARHEKLHQIVNRYLSNVGATQISYDTFQSIFDDIYDSRKVDAIKQLRKVTYVRVQDVIHTTGNNAFSELVENDRYFNVETSVLGLKEAKDIVDIMQVNM